MPPFSNRPRRRSRVRFGTATALAAVLGAPPAPAAASDTGGGGAGGAPAIRAAAPAGFDHLLAPQRAVVDVWFGGRRIGQVEAVFAPGAFRFVDAAALTALLPDVTDRSRVAAVLAQPLDPHAARACTAGEVPECGRLDPEVAGVIFDAARFRVDVFVNPTLRTVQSVGAARYLPRPAAGLSLIDAVGATVAGTTGSTPTYNIANSAILGDGEARLRSDLSWTSGYGIRSDVLAAELDKHDIRYVAGSFWAPGVELTGRRKMLGVAIETQLDTRLDRDLIQGTPLIIFLQQRAQVDILRDGRLLVSHIYDAGNQSLDTSALPDGAYDVVLRIQEADGTRREERRFYSKMRRIAPLGRSLIGIYAGVLTSDQTGGIIGTTGAPFLEASYAHRLRPSLALDATLLATDNRALLQIGTDILTRPATLRLSALAGSTGDVGLLAQLSSTGHGPLGVNFDVRAISSRNGGPLLPDGASNLIALDPNATESAIADLSTGSYVQFTGSMSYRLGNAQFGLLAVYHRSSGQAAFYSVGPSVRWPFLRRGGVELSFSGDFAISETSRTGFAGLSIRRLSGRSSVGASAGARASSGAADLHSGAVGAGEATWQRGDVLGGELDAGAGVAYDPDGTTATGSAALRTPRGTASVDLAQRFAGPASTQYGVALRTGFATGGGNVVLQGGGSETSTVVVKLDDAPDDAHFDVQVDNSPRATITGTGTAAIALPAYRQYDIRIRASDGGMLQYDGTQRVVSLYPGNVATLDWSAARVAAMFGRALWPDGTPVADADITAPGSIARSDSQGYFLITAAPAGTLAVTAPDGRRCQLRLGGITPKDGYAAIGDQTCRPTANPARNPVPNPIIAALSPEKH